MRGRAGEGEQNLRVVRDSNPTQVKKRNDLLVGEAGSHVLRSGALADVRPHRLNSAPNAPNTRQTPRMVNFTTARLPPRERFQPDPAYFRLPSAFSS